MKRTFVRVEGEKQCEQVVKAYKEIGTRSSLFYNEDTRYIRCDEDGFLHSGGLNILQKFTKGYDELILGDDGIFKMAGSVSSFKDRSITTLHGYTYEQREEFRTLAEPLVKWLHENGDPHKTITITYTMAELRGGGEFRFYFESPD